MPKFPQRSAPKKAPASFCDPFEFLMNAIADPATPKGQRLALLEAVLPYCTVADFERLKANLLALRARR